MQLWDTTEVGRTKDFDDIFNYTHMLDMQTTTYVSNLHFRRVFTNICSLFKAKCSFSYWTELLSLAPPSANFWTALCRERMIESQWIWICPFVLVYWCRVFAQIHPNTAIYTKLHMWSGLKSIYKGSGKLSAQCAGVYRQMPAGEEERRAGSRWTLKMMEIHKYASNTNTNTQGKTRNTQIQKYKHTQIQILLLAVWARSEEEKNEISWKSLRTKMALTSVQEYFPKVPGWQNEPIPQG